MYNLPFVQNTLTRELLRDFYKKENSNFFIAAAQAATGDNTTVGTFTTDAEELIQMIANQLDASFAASFAIVKPSQWAIILSTKPNDYSVPGGFSIDANGNVRIAGCPLIPAAWAQSDHVLIFDANEIERVETENLRIEFSFEDQDNFIKNLITARIECFETLNIRRPEGILYRDFSNS